MSLSAAIVLQHVVPDRVHQVRLAEPDAAVDEQRVVRARRRFGDGAARGVRELVRRSDDEGVERVARVEAARTARRRLRRCGLGFERSAASSELGRRAGRAARGPSSVTNATVAALRD